MKNRTIAYFRKLRAKKVLAHAMDTDLNTFLSATFELSRSRVVKNHIRNFIQELNTHNDIAYKLSA